MDTRRAGIEDTGILTELRMLYIAEDMGAAEPENEKRIRKQLSEYFGKALNNTVFGYIAEEDGSAVSCCLLLVTEKPANLRFPHGLTGTVLNVYTKPEHRRKGLAGKLLEMLISDAKSMGLDYIELKATRDAVKLYKSLGFEQEFSKYTDMKLDL